MTSYSTPDGFHPTELSDLFARRFGHVLSERTLLELITTVRRLTESCGFQNPEQYLALLRTLPLDAPMVQALLQTVTNNETYFFRDPNGMHSLREHVLPGLIERGLATRTLRVWSAGCSTGEELYSISILLRELIPDIDFWNIVLVGTDVDAAALARARRGHYKEWSLRVTPDAERKRYFELLSGSTYQLRRRFTRGAVFALHNLADPGQAPPLPGKFDLILCRNVAIYLHQEARAVLAKKIERALAVGGSWVSGPSDPIPERDFSTRVLPGLLEHKACTTERLELLPVALRSASELPAPDSDEVPTWRPPTYENKNRPHTLVPGTQPKHPEPRVPEPKSRPELDTARGLADTGDLVRALAVIDSVIEEHPLEAEAYLLRALLFEAAGSLELACKDLKRVTYLDPRRGEAYLRLGLLLFRTEQREQAVKALRNALVLGYGDESPEASDLRQTAALQLMRALRSDHGAQ